MGHRQGGHALVEQLVELGARRAFCVPGESYLSALDGMYDVQDRFRLTVARQEGGAALMAAAHGKLTGEPGLCFVSRGPGATNASIGVHVARQDASPMLLFIGQVTAKEHQRFAFQEVDYGQMFGALAKEVLTIADADRVPELVARAWSVAMSGEPGPVVVVLPEDALLVATGAPTVPRRPPAVPVASAASVRDFVAELDAAERPLVLVGGSGWTSNGVTALRDFVQARELPVATAMRHQDLIDNSSPSYVGTLGLGTTTGLPEAVGKADVIALVGTRPDALTADHFELLAAPRPSQRILHVHPDPETINRVYSADLAIVSAPAPFAEQLAGHRTARTAPSAWTVRLRAAYLKEQVPAPVAIDPRPFMAVLNASLPVDVIMTAGAGNYTAWHQRYHQYRAFPSQVSTQSGSMGYGVPAAIAAQLEHPERRVVAFAGDGCLLMTGQELATASRYELPLLVVVINNRSYGTIRMHQERAFPGRVSGTDLVNPDFVAFAESFGLSAARVKSPKGLEKALPDLLNTGRPALLEIFDDVDRFAVPPEKIAVRPSNDTSGSLA